MTTLWPNQALQRTRHERRGCNSGVSCAGSLSLGRSLQTMGHNDDEYPTCVETFATLRIYHADASPDAVTEALGITPTKSQVKGINNLRGKEVKRPISGWFLISKNQIESRDVRRHIDWILEQIKDREHALQRLRAEGWSTSINCLWAGIGHGGPMLDAGQMEIMAQLDLSCGFEVFHEKSSEQSGARQPATRPESRPE